MSKKIVRSSEKRESPEDRLRAALAKKPSTYQFTPQGMVVRPSASVIKRGGRIKRPHTLEPEPLPPLPVGKKILITGGIGDFLAIEAFMSNDQKEKVESIFYATRAHKEIKALCDAVGAFPNLKEHVVLWDDWSERFDFVTPNEVERVSGKSLEGVEDWGIARIFPAIAGKSLEYNHSSFLAYTLSDLTPFDLPKKFVVICPYTVVDKRVATRNFDALDWKTTLGLLERLGVTGVVLNIGDNFVPKHPLIKDLSNQTAVLDTIEIMKQAEGYVGVDSFLSVIAAKVCNVNSMAIKSVNTWLNRSRQFYFAPNETYDFIHLGKIDPVRLVDFKLTDRNRIEPVKQPKANEITLNVVQGIGDIFWVYQKFAPYYDKINFQVLAVGDGKVQKRAEGFLKLLPKVGSVNYSVVSVGEYHAAAKARYHLDHARKSPWTPNYACNRLLEDGVRIEDIDPGAEVEWNVDIQSVPFEMPFPKYTVVYTSGNKPTYAWGEATWAALVDAMRTKGLVQHPLVLIGATYDDTVLAPLEEKLKQKGFRTARLIDMDFGKTIHVIKNAESFVGYQSGLNILADNFGVKQVMIYFPYLEPMINTWCQPGHVEQGIFNGFTFDDTIENIVSKTNW